MELNQVRYFLTLAETLNFTRAAESCSVTQPALTRGIQKLEDELGGLLFYRERNLTQLTELGQLVRPLLAQTSAAAQAAREQASAFKRRESAPLRLGLDHSIAASVLTPVLSEMASRISGLELTLRQYSSPEICRLLLEGAIDAGLAVGGDAIPERLNRWKLYEEHIVVLCPETHALAKLDEIPPQRLAEECILRRDLPDSAIDRMVQAIGAAAGIEWRTLHSGSEETHLHEMVKASLGVALAGERQSVAIGLVTRPLSGAQPRTITLLAIGGRPQGPSAAAFLRLMRARNWRWDRAPAISVGPVTSARL